MKFEELKLPYGYPVQLQAGTGSDAVKVSSRLLGCVPGKLLMVSTPKNSRLRTGQKIVVRIMAANGICLFPAVLESTANQPLPMLCLSYPSSVQFKEIRGATRVDVGVDIQVTNQSSLEEKNCEGKISDISLSGAKIELRDAIGEVGDDLSLEFTAQIANLSRAIKVNAHIRSRIERSTREQDEEFPAVYGVEFKDNDEEQLLGLYAFIYSAMAHN
jgi:c-di-GMP-binding flagellar brake protein YcgR